MHKVIEIVDVVLFEHGLRHEVFHESPYLGGGVADRRTRSKDNILVPGALVHRLAFEIESRCTLGVTRVNALYTTLHRSSKAEMFVVVRLVDEECVDTHIIEVLYMVGLAVEHFFGAGLGVRSFLCLFLCVFVFALGLFAAHVVGFEVALKRYEFSLHTLGYGGIYACLFGCLDSVHFLLYLLVDKVLHTRLAIGYHIEYRLRNDYQVPIVVFDFGIELLSPLCGAVAVADSQYLGIRVQVICVRHKLLRGGVLYDNHRLLGSTQTAHFHSR